LPREPRPQDALANGADIVTFSGDKLLGGPQAGLIVGKRDWIRKIKRHPLRRALRVPKLTLAALEATLELYRHPEQLAQRLPTLRLLTRSQREIEALAQRVAPAIAHAVGLPFECFCDAVQSQIGSGSLPVDLLPSCGVFIRCRKDIKRTGRRLLALAAAFRALPMPVIGRIAGDALILDVRTLEDEAGFTAQLAALKLHADGA
jgi:L-seryl-tRNA(Ser) seleniumtransferase